MKATVDEVMKLCGKECPYCKEPLGMYRKVQAAGPCEEQIWRRGEREIETSGLYFKNEGTWKCIECDKNLPINLLEEKQCKRK